MNIFSNNGQTGRKPHERFVQALRDHINMAGTDGFGLPEDAVNVMCSLESAAPHRAAEFSTATASLESAFVAAAGEVGMGDEGAFLRTLTPAQKKAALIVMAASQNPEGYVNNYNNLGLETKAFGADAFIPSNVTGVGNYDFRTQAVTASLEGYDYRNIDSDIAFSVGYAMGAARQLPFSEMFFPPVIVSPDNNGIELTVTQPVVQKDIQLSTKGTVVPRGMRNLVEALMDHKILEDEPTRAYPVYQPGDAENNQYFSTNITPWNEVVAGETILTAAIKGGVKFDPMGISITDTLAARGIFDITDVLEARIPLDTIYLEVTSAATADTSYIPINARALANNLFYRTPVGQGRQMAMNVITTDIILEGTTPDVSGGVADGLALLRSPANVNKAVRLEVNIKGDFNQEFNTMEFTFGAVRVVGVMEKDADDKYTNASEAVLATMRTEFADLKVDSVTYTSYRSNLNRRQRGILCNTQLYREKLMIQLGSPIVSIVPLTDTKTLVSTDAPVDAVRTRNENLAVTRVLQQIEDLRSYARVTSLDIPAPQALGIGRLVMRPYLDERNIDMLEIVQSLDSSRRVGDVQAALVNVIRDMAYKADYVSGYSAALNLASQGSGERPRLIMGMSPILLQHLIVPGDTRLASIGYSFAHATTLDRRIENMIIMTFQRENSVENDPLSSGNMYMIPELITALPMPRNGGISREVMAQPRILHHFHLPLMMVINVRNMSQVVVDRVPLPMEVA